MSVAAALAALIFGLHRSGSSRSPGSRLGRTSSAGPSRSWRRGSIYGRLTSHRAHGSCSPRREPSRSPLLSKGAALPLVAALLLLDLYPLRRLRRVGGRALLVEKIPILLVTLGGTTLVGWALREGAVINRGAEYGLLARASVAAYSFVILPVRFVWPFSLPPSMRCPAGSACWSRDLVWAWWARPCSRPP